MSEVPCGAPHLSELPLLRCSLPKDHGGDVHVRSGALWGESDQVWPTKEQER